MKGCELNLLENLTQRLSTGVMITLIGVEKGGTGKTTLATNLAAMRKAAGIDVLLVDADIQKSSNFWATMREEENHDKRIPCIQKFGKGIGSELLDLNERYSDIIVDAGGRDSVELRAAMSVADDIFIPIQASQFDIWTLSQMDDLVQAAQAFNKKLKAHIVINRASTNPSVTESQDVVELLKDFENLNFSGVTICDRIAFRKAASRGLSVFELSPIDNKAVLEITSLYQKVYNNGKIKSKKSAA